MQETLPKECCKLRRVEFICKETPSAIQSPSKENSVFIYRSVLYFSDYCLYFNYVLK